MNEYMSPGYRGNDGMVGFMLGALVGAATALLLAPATGQETRRKLAETTRKLRDQGEDLAEKARNKGEDLAEKVRNKYEQIRHESTPGARSSQG